MHCRTCDYPLWNLPSRICPECGTPFKPSDFEFVPNSVRFCCPGCGQDYYGIGAKGHLAPPSFACVRCGRDLDMDQMVLLPTEGVDEDRTTPDRMPWLERKRIGRFTAWGRTAGLALFIPLRLARTIAGPPRKGDALLFACLTLAAIAVVAALPLLLLLGIGGGGGPGLGFPAAVAASIFAATLVYIGLWGLTAHGLLRLTGPVKAPIGATYEVICYGAAANAILIVPCFNFYFFWAGWVWWAVSAALMLSIRQGVSGVRAALAAAVFPVLAMAAIVAGFIALMVGMTGAAARIAAAPAGGAQTVTAALTTYAGANQGLGPAHGYELVADGHLTARDLIAPMSATRVDTVPVLDRTLAQTALLNTEQAGDLRVKLAESLPEGAVAHRLGDYVFTHHGIDFEDADAGLWIVIAWPDPDRNPAPPPATSIPVGRADGRLSRIPSHQFDGVLEAQNRLRAASGLGPLPHPKDVTHVRGP